MPITAAAWCRCAAANSKAPERSEPHMPATCACTFRGRKNLLKSTRETERVEWTEAESESVSVFQRDGLLSFWGLFFAALSRSGCSPGGPCPERKLLVGSEAAQRRAAAPCCQHPLLPQPKRAPKRRPSTFHNSTSSSCRGNDSWHFSESDFYQGPSLCSCKRCEAASQFP